VVVDIKRGIAQRSVRYKNLKRHQFMPFFLTRVLFYVFEQWNIVLKDEKLPI